MFGDLASGVNKEGGQFDAHFGFGLFGVLDVNVVLAVFVELYPARQNALKPNRIRHHFHADHVFLCAV